MSIIGTHNLRDLIKCSGYSGTTGQSFRNNVTGAVTGTKLSDYLFHGWNWDTGLPSPPDSGIKYDSGHVFTMSGTMSTNANAHYVIRTGTNLNIVEASYAIQAEGDDVNVIADAVSDTAMSASVQVTSQVNPGLFPLGAGSVSGLAHFFIDGADTDTPPADHNPYEAHFHAQPIGTSPDGGFLDQTWTMQIVNINTGTGLFNSDPTSVNFTARMNNRGLAASDFTWKWFTDSGYTSLYSTGADAFWDQTNAGDDFSLWLQYQFQGGTPVDHGQVTFNDPRSAQ